MRENLEECSVVVDDSDSSLDLQIMDAEATKDGTFEILKIEDDQGGSDSEFPAVSMNENVSFRGPIEDDGQSDKVFGKLIAGELRKMTAAAQHRFKRNVTDLLYS